MPIRPSSIASDSATYLLKINSPDMADVVTGHFGRAHCGPLSSQRHV